MSTAGTALLNPHLVLEPLTLQPGMRVADLGCGRTGHFIFPISRLVQDTGIVYAVDIVKSTLETIASRCRSEGYNNIQTVWSDIERVGSAPIPNESINVCFLVNVLSMVKNKLAVLEEATRLLTENGLLTIIDWQQNLGTLGPTAAALILPETIKALSKQQGLQLHQQIELNPYHYCYIFKKV
jgi:ubiquinone/menaquinone biosynthesis C-methylase UbiE